MVMYSAEEIFLLAKSIWPTARSWARFHTGLPDYEIEDAFVDAVSSSALALELSTSDIQNPKGYVFVAFKNKARGLSKLKAERSHGSINDSPFDWTEPKAPGNLEEKLEKQFVIAELLSVLDLETRFVFEKYFLGYTYDEIAGLFPDRFGKAITATALRQRLRRGIDKLEKKLAQRGITSF